MSDNTNQASWVIHTTDETFQQDVIERSKELPVVVDFWAGWCQPCRMLGPILERLASEYAGKFLLVKADSDQCPVAAAQFNVQALPTVYAVRNGDAVNFFQGLLPEEQLRGWLDQIMPSEAEQLMSEAEKLRSSDPAAAEEKLRGAIASEPRDPTPKIKLAELLMDLDRLQESRQLLSELHEVGFEKDVDQLLSAVEVKLSGEQSGGVEACRQACAKDPENLDLQLNLAEALAAEGENEEALQIGLNVVQSDRAKHGDRARQIMVGIFNLLPDDSELTHDYRRKLSAALY